MTDESSTPPPDSKPAPAPTASAKTAQPRKGFDPAALKGGKQPGGKMLRGTRNTSSAKSRGRG